MTSPWLELDGFSITTNRAIRTFDPISSAWCRLNNSPARAPRRNDPTATGMDWSVHVFQLPRSLVADNTSDIRTKSGNEPAPIFSLTWRRRTLTAIALPPQFTRDVLVEQTFDDQRHDGPFAVC